MQQSSRALVHLKIEAPDFYFGILRRRNDHGIGELQTADSVGMAHQIIHPSVGAHIPYLDALICGARDDLGGIESHAGDVSCVSI